VLAMSQLRSDILSKQKHKEIDMVKRQYKRLHLAIPIQPYESDEDVVHESAESSPSVSDNEINLSTPNNLSESSETPERTEENIDDNAEEYWSQIIESWIDIVNIEDQLENGETIDNEILGFEFKFGSRITHPADDLSAKWKLLELFDDSLEAPISFVF
jgi:hypothetical protein